MPAWPNLQWHEATIFLIAVIGVGAVVFARDRLTAIVSLGIQGFAVAVIFLLFGAPDLSFTQFMVETLAVVILALVMTRLRLSPSDRRPPLARIAHAVLAIACGSGFTLLLLKATDAPFDLTLTTFFNQYSKLIAHGDNVVNVIIVDFRGTDTLGEIAVVAMTGLAILALIRIRAGGGASLQPTIPILRRSPVSRKGWRPSAHEHADLPHRRAVFDGPDVALLHLRAAARSQRARRRLYRRPDRGFGARDLWHCLRGDCGPPRDHLSSAGDCRFRSACLDPCRLGVRLCRRAVHDGVVDLSASLRCRVPLSTVMLFDTGVYLVVVGAITSIALALEEREVD